MFLERVDSDNSIVNAHVWERRKESHLNKSNLISWVPNLAANFSLYKSSGLNKNIFPLKHFKISPMIVHVKTYLNKSILLNE